MLGLVSTFSTASLAAVGIAGMASVLPALGRGHRRLRAVERNPRIATADDIEALVRAHGVPEEQVWAVCDRVREAQLDPTEVWSWTLSYDGNELAALCASDLSDLEVAGHIADRTAAVLVGAEAVRLG